MRLQTLHLETHTLTFQLWGIFEEGGRFWRKQYSESLWDHLSEIIVTSKPARNVIVCDVVNAHCQSLLNMFYNVSLTAMVLIND